MGTDRSTTPDLDHELASLEAKVNALLPSQYHFCADPVRPTSMGSAGLKFGPDSQVAWDQIWTSFCDLALAGGPPHRGTLLEAPTPEEVAAEPAGYQLVSDEVIRGVCMTTGLGATAGPEPGCVAVRCEGEAMASWLLRAVTAENVFTRRQGATLLLPAGPRFRLAKEVKNVVVAVAKTCHYWVGHLSSAEQAAAAESMAGPGLLEPTCRAEILARAADYLAAAESMRQAAGREIGLPAVASRSAGWVGVRFGDEATAAWFVRAAIAEGVLARREGEVLFLPVPPPDRARAPFEAVTRVARLRRLWAALPRPAA
jgi:hypothetical protein